MLTHLASVFLMVKFSLKNGNPILQLLIKLLSNFTLMPLFSSFHMMFPICCVATYRNATHATGHIATCAPVSLLYICTYFLFPANLLDGSIVKATEHNSHISTHFTQLTQLKECTPAGLLCGSIVKAAEHD